MTFYRTESVGTRPISTCFKRCRRRRHGQVLVPAPTGKAVDVAVHEGADDTGYTLAKAPHRVQDGTLKLGHLDLVIIDEAGMVGTNDLRQLLTATTRANAKTVLVGDAHQLAPRQGPAAACSQWIFNSMPPPMGGLSRSCRSSTSTPENAWVDWSRDP